MKTVQQVVAKLMKMDTTCEVSRFISLRWGCLNVGLLVAVCDRDVAGISRLVAQLEGRK